MSPRGRRLLEGAAIAAFFLVLAFVICFPFITRPTAVIPGDARLGESYVQTWSIWWVHHEIFEQRSFPLVTTLLAYPQGGTFFSQMTLNALLLLPLGPLGLPSSLLLNLSLFLTMAAGGLATWLLLNHVVKDPVPALVGSVVFMTCPLLVSFFRSGYLQGLNIVLLPLAWYLYLAMYEKPSVGRAFLAGLGLAGLGLANSYGAVAGLLLVAAHLAWHLPGAIRSREYGRLRIVGACALFTGLLCLPLALWIGYTLKVSPMIYTSGGVSSETFLQFANPDLMRFFVPSGRYDYFHNTECYYLGLAALGFALFPFLRGRVSRDQAFYLFALLLFFVLALGPYLVVDGSLVVLDNRFVRLPFHLLYRHVPFFEIVRHPARLLACAYLALSVLSALGFKALQLRGPVRTAAAILVGGLFAWEYLLIAPVVFPVPVSTARQADYCGFLRAQPGEFGVVNLPYSGEYVRDGIFKYYQTYHGKSINEGFDRRDAPRLEEVAFLQALKELQLRRRPFAGKDAAFAGDGGRLARLGFRYIVVDFSLLEPDDAVTIPLVTRLFGPPRRFRDGLVFTVPGP